MIPRETTGQGVGRDGPRVYCVYHVEVEPLPEGGFLAVCPSLPGLCADGDTIDLALKHLRGVVGCLRDLGRELRRPEVELAKILLRPHTERPVAQGPARGAGPLYDDLQRQLRRMGLFLRCRAATVEVWFWPQRHRWGTVSHRLPRVPRRMLDELEQSLDLEGALSSDLAAISGE